MPGDDVIKISLVIGSLGVISDHLRWNHASADDTWTYNVVQRLTYLAVVFVLFVAV